MCEKSRPMWPKWPFGAAKSAVRSRPDDKNGLLALHHPAALADEACRRQAQRHRSDDEAAEGYGAQGFQHPALIEEHDGLKRVGPGTMMMLGTVSAMRGSCR